MNDNTPIRVLHVVGKMDRGGTESWLMEILRNVDRNEIQLDFIVHSSSPGLYDKEALSLGARLFDIGSHGNIFRYFLGLRRVIQEEGPYDIVHSHVGFFSGMVLMMCRPLSVRVRIAHSHNDSRRTMRSPIQRLYTWSASLLMTSEMTHGLAASGAAANSMFGPRWQQDDRIAVIYCGTDFSRFDEPGSAEDVRDELGVSDSPLVVGHVGRHVAVKNHSFLLRVLKELLSLRPGSKLVLVGSGPLTESIEEEAIHLGISESLVLLGDRSDVPRLLKAGFDVFAFPSTYEGLGLAYIEAQAAGLPCVISDSIPEEAQIVPDKTIRLPVNDAMEWAQHINLAAERPAAYSVEDALRMAENSPFNIRFSVGQLKKFYDDAISMSHQQNSH